MDLNAESAIDVPLRHCFIVFLFTAIAFYLYGLSKGKEIKDRQEEHKSCKSTAIQTQDINYSELLKRDKEVKMEKMEIENVNLKKAVIYIKQKHEKELIESKRFKNKQIDALKQKIEKIELINDFRGHLTKIDEEILYKESQSYEQMKAKYEEAAAERDELLSRSQSMENVAVKFKELEKTQVTRLMQVNGRLKELEQELRHKNTENSELRTQIAELKREKTEFEEMPESNRLNDTKMKELRDDFDAKMLESASEKDDLMIDFKLAQKKIAQMMLQTDAYIQRISKLEQQIVDARKEHENEMAETKRMHNEQIQMRESQLAKKNDSLKDMQKCMDEAVAATNAEMENLESQKKCDAIQINEQCKSLSAKNTKIKQMEQLLNEMIAKYKTISTQRDELIAQINKMKDDVKKYKEDKALIINESVQLQSDIKVLKVQFAVKEKRIKQLENERIKYLSGAQMKSVMKEQKLIQIIHKLEYELKELASQCDALHRIYGAQQIPNQKMKDIKDLLKICETEAQRENKKYSKSIWSIFS